MLQQAEYSCIRDNIRAADVIAFGGSGFFSDCIKWFTRSPISHVGVVLETTVGDVRRVRLIESTSLDGFAGVTIDFLSDRVRDYTGSIYWMPLSEFSRQRLNEAVFFEWLMEQEGKKYDKRSILHFATDWLNIRTNHENFDKVYCSELVCGAWEAGGVIGAMNASEVTPSALCRWQIYRESYYQIKGKPREVNGYNTIQPS